ncbi:hypothetical protein DFH05DRAFT_1104694 [Lentinula detonsa]|uniref:Uncharacterized protein n=1 Tax=Lentinula detonsa TaxID=2804962 RepID=A0A9W8P179_9AGAR|nr:hypothetical protein DFH05DRAFT_1104694 [Lentinula detonsa]
MPSFCFEWWDDVVHSLLRFKTFDFYFFDILSFQLVNVHWFEKSSNVYQLGIYIKSILIVLTFVPTRSALTEHLFEDNPPFLISFIPPLLFNLPHLPRSSTSFSAVQCSARCLRYASTRNEILLTCLLILPSAALAPSVPQTACCKLFTLNWGLWHSLAMNQSEPGNSNWTRVASDLNSQPHRCSHIVVNTFILTSGDCVHYYFQQYQAVVRQVPNQNSPFPIHQRLIILNDIKTYRRSLFASNS